VERAADAIYFGATIGEVCRALRPQHEGDLPKIRPLRAQRAAQPFERLRDAAAAFAARTGQPPLVFQANLGPSRLYRLRADWTTGFFEVGGFKVLADRDCKDADEAAAVALASGARLVVITSNDETYATAVEPLARALKAKDPGLFVLVAGAAKDKDVEAAWRAAGVDEFVNVASNTLELLTRLLTKIGVLP
jgi:methylmalonyl-CoA mutase